MNNEETKIQCALIEWRDKMKRSIPVLHMLFAIPNGVRRGGKAGAIQGAKEKGMGVTPGVPDLFLSAPRSYYHGLYLECKTKSGTVSDAQKEFARRATYHNYEWRIFRTTEQGIRIIMEYLES